MRTTSELIEHKRDGGALSPSEIRHILGGAVDGSIPHYQISAFLMAVYFQGMTDDELADFTLAMIESGDKLSIESSLPIVDKHSTGGVGDKISIPLAPLVAACGVAVPMISGRGLGHTGGTLDKLESIPGFTVNFSARDFSAIVEQHGCIIAGASERIVPADRILYSLRDTSATVPSIPLIASSIMSKKLAEGLDTLILDIKVGHGAFKRDPAAAEVLGRTMHSIGRSHGVDVRYFLTRMDQPLGNEVGNALEIKESIDVLRGKGPPDVTKLVLEFGEAMLDAAGIRSGRERIEQAITSGSGLDKFAEMIEAQGGDRSIVDNPDRLPTATHSHSIVAQDTGYISVINALDIGVAGLMLGAGRKTADDILDLAAGITLKAKIGDQVKKGDTLAVLKFNDENLLEDAKRRAAAAYTIEGNPVEPAALILEDIG